MRSRIATSLIERFTSFLQAHPRAAVAADVVRQVIQAQSKERIGLSAAGVAFWFVIAVFPALIAVLMVLGLILDPQQISDAITELEKASPGTLSGAILRQVQQTAEQRPSSLSLGFFVSLVVVLWSTSTGYYNFARGTLLAYGMPPQPYLRARARAFVGAIIGMLLTAVLAVLAAATLAYAGAQTGLWGVFLVIVNTLIGLAIMALVLAGLFRFAVGRRHPRPLYLPGAALGAVSTIAVFVGFGIYVNYATSYEAVYGALAGAIIFMLCVYFSAYAVLIGAALNADLSARRT